MNESGSIFLSTAETCLDPPITYDKALRARFLSINPRLCYNHYLPECRHQSCELVQNVELTEGGLAALACLALTNACASIDCEILSCYFWHQCP